MTRVPEATRRKPRSEPIPTTRLATLSALLALGLSAVAASSALAQGCPSGFTWQGGALCAAYNMAPGACAGHGGRFVRPNIPGAPTRCEVAAGPRTAQPTVPAPARPATPSPAPPSLARPDTPAPAQPGTTSPAPRPRYSRVECDAHFAAMPGLDTRMWQSIRTDNLRHDDQARAWAMHAARRDAVSYACIAAFPGVFDHRQAEAWLKPPGAQFASRDEQRVTVPTSCRYYVRDVIILDRLPDGDFRTQIIFHDGSTWTWGLNSAAVAGGRASQSLQTKLEAACDSYIRSHTGVRGALYDFTRATAEFLIREVFKIPAGQPIRLKTPEGGGVRG